MQMTSTQRSESANHMLKNYVPPGCPMHMFAQKYMTLLFDRESGENYEEKRTRILRETFDEGALTGEVVGRNVAAGNSNRRWQAKIVGRRYVGGASETGNMGSAKAVLETEGE